MSDVSAVVVSIALSAGLIDQLLFSFWCFVDTRDVRAGDAREKKSATEV